MAGEAREQLQGEGTRTTLLREAECPVCLQEMVSSLILIMIMMIVMMMMLSGLPDLAVRQWSPGLRGLSHQAGDHLLPHLQVRMA